MEISGQIRIVAAPDTIVAALHDLATWNALLHPAGQVSLKGHGDFGIVLGKSFGSLSLTLPGTLRLQPRRPGLTQDLSFETRHSLAGSLIASVVIDIAPLPRACRFSFSGEVTATGPMGRYIASRGERLRREANGLARRLKHLIEDTDPPVA